jgi:hypothetical protein
VVFNTASGEVLLDHLATGLPPGTRLRDIWGMQGTPQPLVVDAQGELTLRLPARTGLVWMARGQSQPAPASSASISLHTRTGHETASGWQAWGQARPPLPFQLVLDGDLAHAQSVTPAADGQWQAALPEGELIDPGAIHQWVAWRDGANGALSAAQAFQAQSRWTEVLRVDDPAGDDSGPTGQYRYPTDPSFAAVRSMDLRQWRVRTLGGALQLELTMAGLSTVWNPPLGFDHLALTLFIELPGEAGGSRVMPLQNGELPGDMRWHRRLRVNGWASALFSAERASGEAEGTPVSPAARVQADPSRNTITLTLPAAALGRRASLAGARLYLNTWDFDAGYRPLGPEAQAWAMGGASADSPKRMDDTAVITLP